MRPRNYWATILVFTAALFILGRPQRASAQAAVRGTGTTNTISVWTSTSTIGNSVLTQSGNNLSLPGTLSAGSLSATSFTCPACVGNAQLNINYAGSSTQGGAANNALNLGGLSPSAFAQVGTSNSFAGNQGITGNLSVSGSVSGSSFSGNGSGLSNVNATTLGGFSPSAFAQLAASSNSFSGNLSVGGTFSTGAINSGTGSFTGNLSVGGALSVGAFSANTINSASSYQIGGTPVLTLGPPAPNRQSLYLGPSAGGASTGFENVAVGDVALANDTSGYWNTAIGTGTLFSNTTGFANTALGDGALALNTTGSANTALGLGALSENTTGGGNTAIGSNALISAAAGGNNTAIGNEALQGLVGGSNNIAVGNSAGPHCFPSPGSNCNLTFQGSNNLFVGLASGVDLTGFESNNIEIDNPGVTGDSGVVRIGTAGVQTQTFIAGIYGASTSGVGTPVLVDSNGQLGTSGNASLNGNLSVGGILSAGTISASTFSANTVNSNSSYQIGGTPVLSTGISGSLYVGLNAGINSSGNNTGRANLGVGDGALFNNSLGSENSAIGNGALFSNTMGTFNTATGADALLDNTTGNQNTAIGVSALGTNTAGSQNTAIGVSALVTNTVGSQNTALGTQALYFNVTGSYNTAIGNQTLTGLISGSNNTAIGNGAGPQCPPVQCAANFTGSNNIFLGSSAGANLTGNETGDIDIGNGGVPLDNGVIRIGSSTVSNGSITVCPVTQCQTQTFIAGIYGVTPGLAASTVFIDSNGQLGTIPSSRRFKYDIQDMSAASSDLLKLRPVTFRYKQAQTDGSHPLQYGLVAEEVADVDPGLVAFDKSGEPQTVLYQFLPAMLLNEFQKQQQQIEAQQHVIQSQQEQLKAQEERLRKLEAILLSKGN